MTSLVKVLYVLIVLSIAADIINLRDDWFKQNGDEISVHSSSLLLPGVNGVLPALAAAARAAAVVRAVAAASRSAKKAARKKEKNQARVKGNARNKARKTQGGSGKWLLLGTLRT